MFEKSVWRKLRNWLVSEYIRLKLWIGEKRSQLSPLKKKNFWFTIIKSRVSRVILVFLLFSCPLTIAFLSSVVHINPLTDIKILIDINYWEEILKVLKYHPAITTIALAIASLPIALTLWLFRNHDIVMNLDLAKYHEAVKNIHDEKASVGLRQVAVTTLLELKEKWMWEKKIKTIVFPYAHLEGLDIDLRENYLKDTDLERINLSGFNLEHANLCDAQLHTTNLRGTNLCSADLTHANLNDSKLQDAELHHANLTYADLKYANLEKSNLYCANLSNVNLKKANLDGAHLNGAYYYKSKEAEEKDQRTPVTKNWLEGRGAFNVDRLEGIDEEWPGG